MTLTSRGVGLSVAGIVLLGAGFAFGYRELAALGASALIATGCALGYVALHPALHVTRVADPVRVTRGESSTVTLTVHNGNSVRSATLLGYDRCGDERVPVPLLRLRPRQDTVVRYPVPTRRRGVVPIGPLEVTRTDPLGLATAARSHGDAARVWVHPRHHPLAAVPAGITRSLDGRIDRVPHGSITFATLREYVIGDELRHVHWRTSARVGELMVREHLDTSLPRMVILLDDRADSWSTVDAFEAACEAAASVVVAAAREDLPIALRLVCHDPPLIDVGLSTRTSRDQLHVDRPTSITTEGAGGPHRGSAQALLDQLAEANPRAGGDLAEAANRLRQQRVGDTLLYLTGAGGLADLGQVTALRGPYPAVVVGVLGSDTPAPSTVHNVLVLDAADGVEFAAAWDGVRSW